MAKLPARITEEMINSFTYEDIRGLDRRGLVKLARAYQRQFIKRVKSFQGNFSYAEQAFRDSFKKRTVERLNRETGEVVIKEINPKFKLFSHFNVNKIKSLQDMAEIRQYLSKMQNFFNPQGGGEAIHTNTLQGIIDNRMRLERYLFGVNELGDANFHVTNSGDLKKLYDLYKEYYHSDYSQWSYQKVFTGIAQLYRAGAFSLTNDDGITPEDFSTLIKYMSNGNIGIDTSNPNAQTKIEEDVRRVFPDMNKKISQIMNDPNLEVLTDDRYPL